ncbi:MAG: hypothetical protein ACJ77K_14010 [Bacteroidia bacterium]|jgi:hypothetical protein
MTVKEKALRRISNLVRFEKLWRAKVENTGLFHDPVIPDLKIEYPKAKPWAFYFQEIFTNKLARLPGNKNSPRKNVGYTLS